MRKAIQNHSMFNLLDIEHGDKVDFWLLKTDDFDQSRFARRQGLPDRTIAWPLCSGEI